MKASQCRKLAEQYRKQADEMIEAETKLGMTFGFSDPVVISTGESAHRYEQEFQFWSWLASLHPKARAAALRKAAQL